MYNGNGYKSIKFRWKKKSLFWRKKFKNLQAPRNKVFLKCTFEKVNFEKPSKNLNQTFTVVLSDKIKPNDYEILKEKNIKKNNLLNIGEFNNKY